MTPVVRYLLVCDDARPSVENPRRVDVFGLMSQLIALDEPAFPLRVEQLCVYAALTECRGVANVSVRFTDDMTGQPAFGSPTHRVDFSRADPLAVIAVSFHVRDAVFAHSGVYLAQLVYNHNILAELPLRVRGED